MTRPLTRRRLSALVAATAVCLGTALVPAAADAAPKGRATKTSAAFSATRAFVGVPVTVSGVVQDAVKGKRKVLLEQKLPSGWRKVGAAKTDANGFYAMSVPSFWLYSTKLRVSAVATRKARGDASRASKVSIVPNWTPTGAASSFAYLEKPIFRLNPCAKIRYKVNAAQGLPDPASAVSAMQTALAAVTVASGLQFKYTGTTDTIVNGAGKWPKGTDLVISWARPDQTSWPIGGNTGAYGGVLSSRYARDAKGKRIRESVRTGIVMDSTSPYVTQQSAGQLLQHELGHVLGLGHVSDDTQYMSPTASLYDLPPGHWGAGDLTGFAKVGLAAGCIR